MESKSTKNFAENKIIKLIFILSIIALFILLLKFSGEKYNKDLKLNNDDGKYLIDISKKAIGQYLNEGTEYNVKYVPKQFLFDNKVIVSIYYNGAIIGIGSAQKTNLVDSVIEAVITALKDNQFKIKYSHDDLKQASILITIVKNLTELIDRSVVNLSDSINLGVDGIYIQKNNDTAIITPQIAVQKGWNKLQLVQNLCFQVKLNKDCWRYAGTKLFKFDSINFIGIRENIFDIYRGIPLVELELLTKDKIFKSIIAASDWQLKMQKEDGSYEYLFNPTTGYYSNTNNLIRQALAASSMANAYQITNNENYLYSSKKNINFILSHLKQNGNVAYLELNNESILGAVAITVIAILELPDYKKYEKELNLLSNFLLSMQRADGSFKTYYNSNQSDDFDFYPGETLLAFVRLYKKTDDNKYLYAVEKSFPFYRKYFGRVKHASFIRWQISAFYEMYEITKNKEYADFVFEMADWIVKQQYGEEDAPYPDFIGGFEQMGGIPGATTPVYVEGISDAYKLAKIVKDENRIKKYGKSLKLASRFILQLQFDDFNAYYLVHPEKAIGAIKGSLIFNGLRIDYTSHSIVALMKIYSIYEDI